MRIGEVAKILGINNSAIRFYERHGLLNSGSINRTDNGYRVYSQKDLEELRLIIRFKEFGLELKEIKHLLCEESKSCGDLVSSLDAQVEKCRQMERLIKNRISSLIEAKNRCNAACEPTNKARKCCASPL